jgi:hypothetical protein
MNTNDLFPSNYIRSADMKGQARRLIMDHVETEEIGEDDVKPVLYFQGAKKGLVLNKTNANLIAAEYGPETDGWIGKEIELFPTKTEFKGQTVDCLRVRMYVPPAPDPQSYDESDESTPF